ncbi:MAG TPA: hypothetical protein EYG86_06615 [Crocinitomicaceae bacterium]|nr:hypothetical protein [Crocinitomicaceae bacterium]
MKANRILYLTLLLSVLLASCKKEKISLPEENDPVFKTNGTFGSDNFSLIAGDNGAFMYTMTETVNGVDVISGELTDGSISLKLGIYDGFLDQDLTEFMNNISLTPSFSSKGTQPLATLKKENLSSASYIQSVYWIIDGNQPVLDSVHIYEPGNYQVCAQITYYNGTSKTLCNDMIIGYNRTVNQSLNIMYDDAVSMAEISVENFPISVQSVTWYVDDVLATNTSANLSIYTNNSIKTVRAEIHFANGSSRTRSVLVDGTLNHVRSVNDFSAMEINSTSIQQDYNIRIQYTSNGVVYDSELADNSESAVQINKIEYYQLNAAGNQVYKIDATVSCFAKSDNGTDIPLYFTTVFGFEVK